MDKVILLAAIGILTGCLIHLVYVDVQRRIIPRKDCYLIALCGSMVQLITVGLSAWLAGFSFGLLALLFCLGVEKLSRRFRVSSMPLGGGDVRLIVALSLATGPWAVWGALGAAVAATLWAIVGLATSRLSLKDTFPMAPCLACWPMVCLGVSLL